ncbi:type VII secretion-associated protein, Rv3446c family [Corynebacterium kutscheri]|uniref:Type VII secretion-associated protein, Rv3446c family n=1 Tax=Corynebacterium kutscheri TaxID=35755 RepID=A0AB38VP98_9CORY|nr:type VII secretion-associated protein [Corynebacterium kutscheri]VEH04855.1 type VII secretion-associated protein, Rv3446c family [Corynebacterium kutscheri]VEH80513.1 type VII secretion-associated protein, Rv3446c family [Corynebacterium kutscheri]
MKTVPQEKSEKPPVPGCSAPENSWAGTCSDNDSPQLEIIILEAATIFEGSETVYRYDLPAQGIIDRWALSAVIEQAQQLLPTWPSATVSISAPADMYDLVAQMFMAKGVHICASQPEKSTHSDQSLSGLNKQVSRKIPQFPERKTRLTQWFHPFYLVIFIVVLGVCVLSWWTISTTKPGLVARGSTSSSLSHDEQLAHSGAVASPSVTTAFDTHVPNIKQEQSETILESQRLSFEGISVELPSGYELIRRVETPRVITAYGRDPELRILMAIDSTKAAPAEAVYQEIEKQISEDPQLIVTHALELDRDARIVTYKEITPDGSAVLWASWVEGEDLFSVGCHTKTEATFAQRAACRAAANSLMRG